MGLIKSSCFLPCWSSHIVFLGRTIGATHTALNGEVFPHNKLTFHFALLPSGIVSPSVNSSTSLATTASSTTFFAPYSSALASISVEIILSMTL